MAIQILLTALSFVAALVCVLAVMRSDRTESRLTAQMADCFEQAYQLRSERNRITVSEREIEALRRELRKLSGKFYADLKMREEEDADGDLEDFDTDPLTAGRTSIRLSDVCQNWVDAKQAGPGSEAAKCECLYCMTQRAERAHVRGLLVPKTVGAQIGRAHV